MPKTLRYAAVVLSLVILGFVLGYGDVSEPAAIAVSVAVALPLCAVLVPRMVKRR